METNAMVISRSLTTEPEFRVPAVPWRDPHTVSPRDLADYIGSLEEGCREHPDSPALWTCLGVAYAVNYDIAKSMDALETATAVEPTHFWARLKYGELLYRLRALDTAEQETLKAVELAEDAFQLAMARKQLREIRAINPQRVRVGAPTSALGRALFLSGLLLFAVAVVMWT